MMKRYSIGFIIEQALGHVTHGKNLQKNIELDAEIESSWGFPVQPQSGLMALPGIRNWTIQAGLQANQSIKGMHKSGRKLDALFFHTQVTAILAKRWMEAIPSVVSLDATPLQYDALGKFYEHEGGPSWLEKFKFQMNHACYLRSAHLVTWSSWAKSSLVKDYQIPEKKITVIPPGVNIRDWSPNDIGSHQKLQEDVVNLLFVGGALKRKGGNDLIKAFKAARSELTSQELTLHLVTKDQPKDKVDGMVVYNNMRPNSDALKNLYKQADIFCLPTYGDCLPMVLSEASASALPSISTKIAAIPEIVEPDKSGLLVDPGDVRGLKESIISLAKNPTLRHEMGANALHETHKRFDAQANAAKLFSLLKSIAK